MRLVDLMVHGGSLREDGSFTPVAIQAASQGARQWLEDIAVRFGTMLSGALVIERLEDVVSVFSEMPEEFCVF